MGAFKLNGQGMMRCLPLGLDQTSGGRLAWLCPLLDMFMRYSQAGIRGERDIKHGEYIRFEARKPRFTHAV